MTHRLQKEPITSPSYLQAWLESRGKVEMDGRVYEPANVWAMDTHLIGEAISAGRMLQVPA